MMVLAEALSAQDATQNVWHRRFGTRKLVITPGLLDAYNAYSRTQQQPVIPEQSKKYCEPLANAQLVDAHLLAHLTALTGAFDASKLDNLAKLAAESPRLQMVDQGDSTNVFGKNPSLQREHLPLVGNLKCSFNVNGLKVHAITPSQAREHCRREGSLPEVNRLLLERREGVIDGVDKVIA